MNFLRAYSSLCISHIFISFCNNWHAKPIFHAVSSLSPVSIHTFMLASLKLYIVSGTLSCNLSSTQVAPIRNKSLSNSSKRLSCISLIASRDLFHEAKSIYLMNISSSSSETSFIAINKTLNPCRAESSTNFSTNYSSH